MDVMRIIKPSVSIPNNTLLHRTKFKINSLRVQQSGLLLSFPIYHTATTSTRLFPILPTNYKQNTTSTSFPCCCTKEDNYAETITDSDTGVWQRRDLKLQTPFVWMLFLIALKLQPPFVWMLFLVALIKLQPPFVWMLFLGAIKGVFPAISKLIPRPIYRSFLLYVDKLELRYGSKKMEPMNISFDDLVGVDATIREFGSRGDIRIERLFDEARACSPSIIYIRFVEDIAKRGDCKSIESLVQLHTEMEKCKDNGRVVIVIVSSDYPEKLDPVFTDSHMFLDQVRVGKPDEDARRKIIGLHLKGVLRKEDKEAFCNIVASQTSGLVWRELRNLAMRCKLSSASRGDVYVNLDDVFQALEKINNDVLSNLDKPMALENLRRRVESVPFGSHISSHGRLYDAFITGFYSKKILVFGNQT